MPSTRAALVTVLAALLLAVPAQADTLTVDTEADENDPACTPGDCSLREAVNHSNAGDVVLVPPGDYPLGDELVVGHSLTIDGTGPGPTVLDSEGSDRTLRHEQGALTLRDLTITGGDEPDGFGGGISSQGSASQLRLERVRVTDNRADTSSAAAVTAIGGGGVYSSARTIVTDSEIDGNSITALTDDGFTTVGGGGIYIEGDRLTLTRSEVRGNFVQLSGSGAGADVTAAGGGGVYLRQQSQLELLRSTVAGNSATVQSPGEINTSGGGGIFQNAGTLTAFNSTIAGNSTDVAPTQIIGSGGGGLFTNGTEATLTNVTLAANSALSEGGNNTGGGIYREGGVARARNTIVALNQADEDANDNCWGSITSLGHNLEDENTCGLSGPGDKLLVNPRLGALQPNGTFPRTMRLLKNSPAVDAGLGCPPLDERGVPRPRGVRCDIGAYEAPMPSALTGATRNRGTTSAGLRGRVNPSGLATSYRFQYGRTAAYGQQTALVGAGAGTVFRPAAGKATALKPARLYHYRLVATNSFGTTRGLDRTFITAMKLPRRSCSSPGTLRVPIGRPPGARVASVKAFVKGNERDFDPTVVNGDIKQIRLDGLPRGKFKLRVVATLKSGRKVTGKRTYRACG